MAAVDDVVLAEFDVARWQSRVAAVHQDFAHFSLIFSLATTSLFENWTSGLSG